MPNKKEPKKAIPKKVENAYVISQYYGFDAIDLPPVTKEDKDIAESIKKGGKFSHEILPPVEEHIALIREHKDKFNKEEPDALLFYCEGQAKGTHKKSKLKQGEKLMNLHVIGSPKSIAEAVLIKTAICILEEEGFKNVSVEINHLGGKDSMNQFLKELTNYYKKNLSEMNATCRQVFKDGPHALVQCKDQLKAEVIENSPSPLNFLSENNRKHFKEVVEYLDSQEISYEINKDILGDPHYSTDTVFTILDKKTGKILATGTRYNQLSKKTGTRKDIPSASVTIKLSRTKKVPGARIPKKDKIKFFFIQLGFTAKLKSLQIIEELRKAKIPIYQSLSNDRLSTQLKKAKRKGVTHILLMGQQEALDDIVVVRDVNTHQQESVKIKDLPEYLRKLK